MTKLIAYVIDGHDFRIRPAPPDRDWMDGSDQRFAYRCLPLNIANAHGWEIMCNASFSAMWNGHPTTEAIHFRSRDGKPLPAISHFGRGILTFHVPCLFQTDPGVDLFATGPINRPKDGIAPLTGIIETDWSPYTFTMNWQFTRPGVRVHFSADEPFCHIFPVKRGELEVITPTVQALSTQPELEREYLLWSSGRGQFNAALSDPASKAAKEKWQKSYFQGVCPSGEPAPGGHQSKLRLRAFKHEK
ncbi:hypothetical protein HQ945_05155 [Phyllobacterium sp. BT25]|uniref:Uncharacterized protein n=1 Tax=Phyllobacterium pellucidum TaxID=2740464 RepID=A0A849VK96_9HYPH|nr:DUF6065 family protein [Phyllobacterium pellucidum]NTS30635.1 hypothetical protein [Phyllobacterium pellucidum]